MEYGKKDPLEVYGTASRTLTLPLGYWAQVAEVAEMNKQSFRDAMKFIIKTAHREVTNTNLHK